MELKVWVDGVVRVVCGLSEETSCQDVVIALAQAIGQTGRYVLIQKLRDSERQLLANERPLESLAKLGQHGNDVQFFLRRTGPSSSDAPGSGSSQDQVAPLPKHLEPEHLKRSQPKKSLTFNLGPSTSPKTKPLIRKSPQASPKQRGVPSPVPPHHAHSPSPHSPTHSPQSPSPSPPVGPSKEEVFRQVLQQQERLKSMEAQLDSLERETGTWGRASPAPSPAPGTEAHLQEELETLEQVAKRNQAELAHQTFWEEKLQAEVERERGMRSRLKELHDKMDDYSRQLRNLTSRSFELEREIQRESMGGSAQPGRDNQTENSLDAMRVELQSQERHSKELEGRLTETDWALSKAESQLQEKQEEVEELNKELRQCNLQQFIQQAGVLPTHTHSRTDLSDQLDQFQLAHLLQEGYRNGGDPSESPPRPTAKQFLGHPRNLQNPLVSSLNPEVVTSRESSWR
ncbi:hypothetical protein UPYG_G00266370 [Umbra pygmaea]|uniref:Ras-associating domain-containing protein n=1 Tax=Umbra pygmaea TaxID=75934 RepID=A0ABD0WBI4_UMBPY